MNNNTIYVLDRGENYELRFDYSQVLLNNISKIPMATFDEKGGCWIIPRSQYRFIKEFGEYAVRRNLARDVISLESADDIKGLADKMPDLEVSFKMLVTPYDYQRRGIQYMLTKKRTFNCDDMGLGKTMQSIAAISIAKAYPCLVVSPAAMKVTWQREFFKFIGKKAIILDDSNRNEWHQMFVTGVCNIFITNYESLKKYFIRGNIGKRVTTKSILLDRRVALFKSIIVDECHRCKEKSTKWSKYLERICQQKEYIFMLTGTPMVTRTKDLVQQLRIMGRLEDFGGARRFISRYGGKNVSPVMLSELNYRLWQTCYFRRDKSLVLKELPDMIRQYRIIDITNRGEYEKAENDLRGYLQEYTECDDEKLKAAIRSEAIVKIGVLRRLSAEGKMQEAISFIKDILDADQKLIVFAAHKSVVAKIKKCFRDAVTVTGDDNQDQKQKSVDKFQNDPDCRLIILNIKSGGVGITLTAASNVLFVEFPWTAADCDQCECRAYRNGQKNVVSCTYLLGHDTFDEDMYDIINRERGESALVTGSKSSAEERTINNAIRLLNIKQ